MKLTLGQFAKEADIGKATVKRWLDNGWITGEKVGSSYSIDASELARVKDIKEKRWQGNRSVTIPKTEHSSEQNDTPKNETLAQPNNTVSGHEIEILKLKLEAEKSRADSLEQERDEWREQAKRLAITHEAATKAENKPVERRKKFLWR